MTISKLSPGSTLSFAGVCIETLPAGALPAAAVADEQPAAKGSAGRLPSNRRSFAQFGYAPLKRMIDFFGAIVLIVLLWPLMTLIAFAIRLSSPGPIIFRQRRLTAEGREFTIFKFRTMYRDAESKTGAVWAKKHDPRVTFVGRFLRKTHLDELPQLFNVVRGEMSLIGPRPERPELVSLLREELPSFNRRLEVKAGITGLAQTSNGYASNIESYRRKLAFDILYVKRRCFWLDMRIAARTVVVVLTGGAYGAKR